MHSVSAHRQPHIKTSFRGLVPAEILRLATDRRKSYACCLFIYFAYFLFQHDDHVYHFLTEHLGPEEIIFTCASLLPSLLFFCVSFAIGLKGEGGVKKKQISDGLLGGKDVNQRRSHSIIRLAAGICRHFGR